MEPKSKHKCPIKHAYKRGRGRGHRQKSTRQDRGESNVTRNMEIGVMWPQTKECQQPPKIGRVWQGTDSSSEPSKGQCSCRHLDFRPVKLIFELLVSRAARE